MLKELLPENPDIETLNAVEAYLSLLIKAMKDESFSERHNLSDTEKAALKALTNHTENQLNMIREIVKDIRKNKSED